MESIMKQIREMQEEVVHLCSIWECEDFVRRMPMEISWRKKAS